MKTLNNQTGGLYLKLVALGMLLAFHSAMGAVTFTVSPSTVSNTYSGNITLQVAGLTSGDTVVVQKFLDINSNGIIDAADLLVQQFQLTDGQAGMVIGGITNFDVPGDLDTTAGTITAQLHFYNGDFSQRIAGKYLFKLSSPVGHFTALTNSFVVTNFPYAQNFTGNVVSNSTSIHLSNAVVLLFPAPRGGDHGPGTPVAGSVVSSSGTYSIPVPPGTYVPMAFKSNFVANYSASPVLTLGVGATINTNLSVTNATTTISGKMEDATNSGIGLPGVFLPASATNGYIAFTFTDTNGNFTIGVPVDSGKWKIGDDDSGLILHGYVGWAGGTNVPSGSSGVVLAYPRASGLFYGNVSDNLGNALQGIDLESSDVNSNLYSMDAYTDTNGNYELCLVGGLSNDSVWQLQVSSSGNPDSTDYVYSTYSSPQNGGVSMSVGQVVQANITAIYGSNQISGHVQDNLGNTIAGLGVYAYANINGINYFPLSEDTDTNGNYVFNVPNGSWDVSVNCSGGSDSLSDMGNYACPSDQLPNILNDNSTNNFIVQQCGGVSIITTNLPNGLSGSYYDQFLNAESCNPSFSWQVLSGNLGSSGLTLSTSGELYGNPNAGTYDFTVQVTDGNNSTASEGLSLVIATNNVPPPSVNVAAAAGGQVIVYYPLSGSNYVLQTTTNLSTGPWVTATNGTTVIGVTFTNSGPAQFFRLVSP